MIGVTPGRRPATNGLPVAGVGDAVGTAGEIRITMFTDSTPTSHARWRANAPRTCTIEAWTSIRAPWGGVTRCRSDGARIARS